MEITVKEQEADNKYGKLKKKLVDKLKTYELEYFREDKPVPFCGLQLQPVKVRDYEIFSSCIACLTLEKNTTVEGIKKTNLDFLVYKMQDQKEGQMWSFYFQKLFELIFGLQNGLRCKNCGKIITFGSEQYNKYIENCRKTVDLIKQLEDNKELIDNFSEEDLQFPELSCDECGSVDLLEIMKIVPVEGKPDRNNFLIDGHIINSKDFDDLRKIVLFQNFPDYFDDSWVDPAVKKDYEERKRLERLKNDVHASIERKAICLSISTNYKIEDIYDMSIRRFELALSAIDDLINYKIMKTATMSGFVSLPKGKTIEHWIYKPDKDMYGDAYKDTEELQQEVSNL